MTRYLNHQDGGVPVFLRRFHVRVRNQLNGRPPKIKSKLLTMGKSDSLP